MPNKQKENKAYELGQIAFIERRDCVPALDGEAMKLIEGFKPGEGAAGILLSWTRGYTELLLAKQPWEMTEREWSAEFSKTQVNDSGCGGEWFGLGRCTSLKGLDRIVKANHVRQEFLKMGLKDISMSKTDPYCVRTARYYDVIKHALTLDLPVSEHVLAQYQTLLEKQAV